MFACEKQETLTEVLLMTHIHRKKKLALTLSLALAVFAAFGFSRPSEPGEQAQHGKVWRPTKVPAGVNFVGSQACAECHKNKVVVQEKSPMGLALELVAEAQILSSHKRLEFHNGKFSYEIV